MSSLSMCPNSAERLVRGEQLLLWDREFDLAFNWEDKTGGREE